MKWALRPPALIWPFFFVVMFVFSFVYLGAASARSSSSSKRVPVNQSVVERTVNVTLDTVMWVHEQHRGKMSWAELNAEVCRHMKVNRSEPWQR